MAKQQKTPILMYHGITNGKGSHPEERDLGAGIYDVSLKHFREQMHWLRDNGYRTFLPRSSNDLWHDKEIVITFDDGEMNNFEHALPVLKECGFQAHFFMIVGRVKRPGYMGWDELKALNEAGMVVGSHGLSHEVLTDLLDTQIEQELSASRRTLQRNLDAEINTLSIPRGFCDNKVLEMAQKAGYKTVFISDSSPRLTQPCLPRVAVKNTWNVKRLRQTVTGTIPWRERMTGSAKRRIKGIFSDAAYHKTRNLLISLEKWD